MPRTRRTAAPAGDAEIQTAPESAKATPDVTDGPASTQEPEISQDVAAEAIAEAAPAKTRRTRAPRPKPTAETLPEGFLTPEEGQPDIPDTLAEEPRPEAPTVIRKERPTRASAGNAGPRSRRRPAAAQTVDTAPAEEAAVNVEPLFQIEPEADAEPVVEPLNTQDSDFPAPDQAAEPGEDVTDEEADTDAGSGDKPKLTSSARRRHRTRLTSAARRAAAQEGTTREAQGQESSAERQPQAPPGVPGERQRRSPAPMVGAPVPASDIINTPAAGIEPSARPARRRGRKTPEAISTAEAITLAGLADLATPVEPAEATPGTEIPLPPRRGRGRRRQAAGQLEPAIVDAVSTGETTVESEGTEETDEAGRRGRRPRRGGRRRRNDDNLEITEDTTLIVGGDTDVEEEEEEEEEIEDEVLLPYPPPPPPVYVAPIMVEPVQRTDEYAPAIAAVVERDNRGGHPWIVINGERVSPAFLFVNTESASDGDVVESQIRCAAAQGIHLYSSVIYLPLKNAYGERSFGQIDAVVQQILSADPDAYIMPRLQFVPPTTGYERITTSLPATPTGVKEMFRLLLRSSGVTASTASRP
ncbi:MAG: hypothetical protein ACLQVD_06090 [Capsulimonadaceae bacterium]